ncbi:MAG: ornithine carbamoyltransferase [Verrucomicrobiales bacterium]
MKHLLSLQQLTGAEIADLVNLGAEMKASRGRHATQPLAGQTWAMIFQKSSTRTRVSDVGIRELGGGSMFLSGAETQLGRGEPIQDTARVLGRFMVHGARLHPGLRASRHRIVRRTVRHPDDQRAATRAKGTPVPDPRRLHLTMQGSSAAGRARRWRSSGTAIATWRARGSGQASRQLGFTLRIGAPHGVPAQRRVSRQCGRRHLRDRTMPKPPPNGADAVYRRVGQHGQGRPGSRHRIAALAEYQVNAADLLAAANPEIAIVMLLPAYRGKEIDEGTLEKPARRHHLPAGGKPGARAKKAVLAAVAAG